MQNPLVKDDETPEQCRKRALHELRERHEHNKERAIVAITQKNNLQNRVEDLIREIQRLETKSKIARGRGNRAESEQYLLQKQHYEALLPEAEAALAQAQAVSEQVKSMVKREEEHIRQKAVEIQALNRRL